MLKIIFAFSFIFSGVAAHAAVSPLSVGMVPPVQFPPKSYGVTGVRINPLLGQHRDVYGLDLSLLGGITDQDFVGLAVAGGVNINRGMTTVLGLQLAGVGNFASQKTNVWGLQIAGLMNRMTAESAVNGLQISLLANIAPSTVIRGAQIGLYNKAKSVYGFQIGLINDCDNLHGIQLGMVNFHRTGLFYVSPFLNIGF